MKKSIRILSLFLVMLTFALSVATVNVFALECEDFYIGYDELFGDADSDGRLTVKDATAVQKHLAKINNLERRSLMAADVDANGKVSIADATDIQKYLANLIPCFEADPFIKYNLNDVELSITYEYDGSKKISVDIEDEGFYSFEFKRKGENSGVLHLYDENMDYLISSDTDGNSEVINVYLAPGRYIVIASVYFVDNNDTYRFSVKENKNGVAFDQSTAQEIKIGDEINIPAGQEESLFKLTYDSDIENGHIVFVEAQGDNLKTDFTVYNSLCVNDNNSAADDTLARIKFMDYTYSNVVADEVRYILVTQDKEGQGFTLTCKTYLDTLMASADEAKLNESVNLPVTQHQYDWGVEYYADYMAKFTPEKDGFYKVTVSGQEDIRIGSDYSFSYFPEVRRFNKFVKAENKSCCIEELKAGNTYILWVYGFDDAEINDLSLVLTESNEEEYNTWYEAASKTYTDSPEYQEPVEIEYTDIGLGEEVYVSLRCVEETEDYMNDTEYFKFTAPEDMTVVAYSQYSEDAHVYIYDGNHTYVGWGEDSGNLTTDFAVCCSLKMGETCYFEVSSYEYFGDGFYFSVVDINEYESLIRELS